MHNAASLNIREYTSTDFEDCLALFESNLPRYFAEHEREEFVAWLNDPKRASYSVAEVDGQVIACGGIYHDPEQHHVGMAWGMVRRDLHGNGIGRRLTEFRLNQMVELYPSLERRLATSQHTYQFYEKMGFTVQKVTEDGFGPGIDRYDMSLV